MSFYTFLPKILNMSLTASVAIVFVLLLRLLLKKAPKVISYALWGVVLIRLLCPVSIESGLSLFGLFDTPTASVTDRTSAVEYVPSNIVHTEYPEVVLPVPGVGEAITEVLPQGEEQLRADPMEAPVSISTYVWAGGVLIMAVYGFVTYLRLRRRLVTASPLRENIYLADDIDSPFVMGLIRPKIYLPSAMEEREQSYIILHEQHHIRRLDHIVKALAFVALCVHWFNPLVWVAFILSGKDMEMSCDEAVVRKLGTEIRADYSASLLSLATGKRIIAGMPLAFGEGDTRGRIKNLANWKKPAFWVVLVAVIACVVLAVCLLTNPAGYRVDFTNNEIVSASCFDFRSGDDETLSNDLNQAQIDELMSRLKDVKSTRKSDEYAGFTPGYQISAKLQDDTYIRVSGYSFDKDDMVDIEQGDQRYVVSDKDFCQYLSRICTGGDIVEASTSGDTGTTPVTWTYSPMMSATWHAVFHFNFDVNHEFIHIETACDNGMLWNLRADGQPSGKSMRFEAGQPVCWVPSVGDSPTDTAEEATISFTVYDGGEMLYQGAFEITRTGTDNGRSSYEARLAGTDLLTMQQEDGNMGASVILSDRAAIIAYSDLNHNRVNEQIVVREVYPGQLHELTVLENGKEIWQTEAGLPHVGWNTIMLYSEGGQDYLVEYHPSMYQGVGSYNCTVFSLEGNKRTVKEEWSVDFELDMDGTVTETAEMIRFAKEVGLLLRNSNVLLSTELGILVDRWTQASALPQLYPVRFDPDEILAAIEGPTGVWEPGLNTAGLPEAPIELVFASGAGAWGTVLTLNPDGSFVGDYSDSDMDTRYVCKFEGQFTDIQQISNNCWSMKLGDIAMEQKEGTTWTEGSIHYIASSPHGISDGTDFLLYAPGTSADLLPADCRDWWPNAYLWRSGQINAIEGWSLCNINAGYGFFQRGNERMPYDDSGRTNAKPLTTAHIERINETFSPIVFDRQGNPISVNTWSCFFTSYYDDVREMNFEEFLAYFPGDGSTVDEEEFAALKELENFLFYGEVSKLADMPVPVHRYPRRLVDLVLGEYAGISTADLDTSGVEYLPDYDAFYNYTSDAGHGMFRCTRGEVEGDIVRLYEELDYGTDMLTLQKVGNSYHIVAHQNISES